jgi:hypothetical protein
MRRVMAVLAGETAATRESAMIGQDEQRYRSGANQCVAREGPHLKRARRLEAGRWRAATRGAIRRWFAELEALFRIARREMEWNFGELMVAASRARKAVATGNEGLLPAGQEDATRDARCLLQLQG